MMSKLNIPSKAIKRELEEIHERYKHNSNYGELEHQKVKLTFWQKLIGIFKGIRK
jgi:hypothetical protein